MQCVRASVTPPNYYQLIVIYIIYDKAFKSSQKQTSKVLQPGSAKLEQYGIVITS
jgi:hypothetical protein